MSENDAESSVPTNEENEKLRSFFDKKVEVPPKEKTPTIINMNPHSGEIIDIITTTTAEMRDDTTYAQKEQKRNIEEAEAETMRKYKEALEKKKLQDLVSGQGEKRGRELSSFIYTNEGRKKVEDLLSIAITVNKGILGSKENMQNKLIEMVDEEKYFGSVESQKVIQDWERRNRKLSYPEFIEKKRQFEGNISKTIHGLKDIRQFLLTGKINVDYSNANDNKLFEIIRHPLLQDLYNESFRNGWVAVKNQSELSNMHAPWYLQESQKREDK